MRSLSCMQLVWRLLNSWSDLSIFRGSPAHNSEPGTISPHQPWVSYFHYVEGVEKSCYSGHSCNRDKATSGIEADLRKEEPSCLACAISASDRWFWTSVICQRWVRSQLKWLQMFTRSDFVAELDNWGTIGQICVWREGARFRASFGP